MSEQDEMAVCAVPGCDTLTANGICDECDNWVTEQVIELEDRRLFEEPSR